MKHLITIPAVFMLVALAGACTEYDPTSPEEGLAASVTPAVGSHMAVLITGAVSFATSNAPVAITARLLTDGSASGIVHLGGLPAGLVVALDRLDANIWCLKFPDERSDGDRRFTVWIRDIGDGVNTFDEFRGAAAFGRFLDCSFVSSFSTATRGDFTVRVFE